MTLAHVLVAISAGAAPIWAVGWTAQAVAASWASIRSRNVLPITENGHVSRSHTPQPNEKQSVNQMFDRETKQELEERVKKGESEGADAKDLAEAEEEIQASAGEEEWLRHDPTQLACGSSLARPRRLADRSARESSHSQAAARATSSMRLVVLSSADYVSSTVAQSSGPAYSGIWGLARSARQEQSSALNVQCVELSRAVSDASARASGQQEPELILGLGALP